MGLILVPFQGCHNELMTEYGTMKSTNDDLHGVIENINSKNILLERHLKEIPLTKNPEEKEQKIVILLLMYYQKNPDHYS